MLGAAAVTIWCDVAAEVRDEFEDWHTREHMPERLAIAGFLRGTRWRSEPPGSFFILYELDSAATLEGPAYLARLNDPTPWSRKMMPHHRNMVRSLCRVRESRGEGWAKTMATLRFSPGRYTPHLPTGVPYAALLQSQPMSNAPTAEQKIRGGDGMADWVLLLGGEGAESAARRVDLPGATIGLYRLANTLTASQ